MIIQASTDVRAWAVTTKIAVLGMNPGLLHLQFDAQQRWPSVDIGGGTLQQATLWVALFINGEWHVTAAERLRPNQVNRAQDLAYSNWIGRRWLTDQRWGPMMGYTPKVGERVGFMVTQGSLRADSTWTLAERSELCWISWPADGSSVLFP
jgi:hypothetical protein